MTIPYRTRRAFRNLCTGLLFLMLILVVVWLVWLLWLDRYIVYTRDGAKLDFSLSVEYAPGEVAVPPEPGPTFAIQYDNGGGGSFELSTELTQLYGYYADKAILSNDISEVISQVQQLPAGTPVMLDVKDIVGRFFYTTTLGRTSGSVNTQDMDALIATVTSGNYYAIARLPALRDYYYGLDHVSDGLPTSGGYLWMDSDKCYWLNPASEGTLSHLMQIVAELKALGFHEVVFSDFCFPDTDQIVFKGDRDGALISAATTLVTACSTDTFAVSFQVPKPTFELPAGRTRMYLANKAAADVASLAAQTSFENPEVKLVFVSETNDTRFDLYGVLRPITSAQPLT